MIATMALALSLLHPALPEFVDEVLRLRGWSWEDLSRGIELEDQTLSAESLGWFFLQADPVLWCETTLVNRPEDGGGLWVLFPYQRRSMRDRGNTVHQCAAEVGKTREIVGLSLWKASAGAGSCLVGSALDGDLDEIWEETQYQLRSSPFLGKQVVHQTTKPYRRITFENGLRLLYRPAGFDGRAWRGIHVRGAVFCDEAAKIVNSRAWHELWRAGKPGCEYRLYSVPTGDRLCDYQRIADAASNAPAEGQTTAEVVAQLLAPQRQPGKRFTRYWWPKWVMPAPYWSEERRAEKIEQYGSPDDPGYVHNVEGLPGDPEYSVFPERLLGPAIQHVPDYLSVRLAWDSLAARLDVDVWTVNQVDAGESEDESAPELFRVTRESHDVSGWATLPESERTTIIRLAVRGVLEPIRGDCVVGVDPGSLSSPCEILIFRAHGMRTTLIRRVSLRGLDWLAIRDVIAELDTLMVGARWGIDATGVGRGLVHHLQPILLDRCAGFVFNMKAPDVDFLLGEPLIDPTSGRALSLSYKELGTQLVERALSERQETLPRDPEVIHLLRNHTYTQRGDVRTYSKSNDHVADALRCKALAHYLVVSGLISSAPITYAVPSGETCADTLAALKGYS